MLQDQLFLISNEYHINYFYSYQIIPYLAMNVTNFSPLNPQSVFSQAISISLSMSTFMAHYFVAVLTFSDVEKTPYGRFSMGKSQSDVYSTNDFMMSNVFKD